jgi:hypothetical protein
MERRELDPDNLAKSEDWQGNNVAFTCPACDRVFLVSERIHGGKRRCPDCGKVTGFVTGGAKSGGSAWIESD